MDIQKIKVDKLNPAKYNPCKDLKLGDSEYEKLKKSIETFEYVEPVIWNKRTGNIVGGHQRYKILKEQGVTDIDCVVVDMDESEEKALNIALNKVSGDCDLPKLIDLIGEFELRGFNGTLHAWVIRANIVLALAINHQAITQKCASSKKPQIENPKLMELSLQLWHLIGQLDMVLKVVVCMMEGDFAVVIKYIESYNFTYKAYLEYKHSSKSKRYTTIYW